MVTDLTFTKDNGDEDLLVDATVRTLFAPGANSPRPYEKEGADTETQIDEEGRPKFPPVTDSTKLQRVEIRKVWLWDDRHGLWIN